ncbi:MAG: ribosomal protein S18-alanine N-acetyltransferase [Sphingomonadaceae bacterium]
MIAPADDIDQIMAVMAAAFDPAYGEAWNRRQVEDALLAGSCHYGLAYHAGQCAGFFLSRTALDEEELLLLGVTPACRRLGLGRQLLDKLLEDARGRAVDKLFLEMRQGNPAEFLYRKCGFEPSGLRPGYYRTKSGERIDAITFTLSLT